MTPTWFAVAGTVASGAFCFAVGFALGSRFGVRWMLKKALGAIAAGPPP